MYFRCIYCVLCSYSVPSDQWSPCSGMSTCRSAAGAAMLEGIIYVVGMYMCTYVHCIIIMYTCILCTRVLYMYFLP